MPLLARRFSITNFLIASSALGFQVFVLYPWHTKLDDDFAELRRENVRLVRLVERRFRLSPAAGEEEKRGEGVIGEELRRARKGLVTVAE